MRVFLLPVFLAPLVAAWDSIPDSDSNRRLDRSFQIPSPPAPSNSSKAAKQLAESTSYTLLNYVTPDYDEVKVKRVVIQLHGLARDAWSYFDETRTALLNATSTKTGPKKNRTVIKEDEVVIFTPMFLNTEDEGAYPVDADTGEPLSNTIVWNDTDWANGGDSVIPYSITDQNGQKQDAQPVSSFEALDYVIKYFSNTTRFPSMNTIVVAGHSLGAQMTQRYALLGAVPSGTVPVHFVVANPGSFAYLSPWRPNDTSGCPDTYDHWKYGLSVYNQRYLTDFVTQSLDTSNDVTSVVSRYRERLVHYLFGLADFGEGDQRCEALAQGDYHLMRGRNFMRHLRKMDGGFPEAQTVNYIPKIQHDPLGMFTSRPGLEKLFAINFDGGESPVAVGDADPDRQYFYPSSAPLAVRHTAWLPSLAWALFAYLLFSP